MMEIHKVLFQRKLIADKNTVHYSDSALTQLDEQVKKSSVDKLFNNAIKDFQRDVTVNNYPTKGKDKKTIRAIIHNFVGSDIGEETQERITNSIANFGGQAILSHGLCEAIKHIRIDGENANSFSTPITEINWKKR